MNKDVFENMVSLTGFCSGRSPNSAHSNTPVTVKSALNMGIDIYKKNVS